MIPGRGAHPAAKISGIKSGTTDRRALFRFEFTEGSLGHEYSNRYTSIDGLSRWLANRTHDLPIFDDIKLQPAIFDSNPEYE